MMNNIQMHPSYIYAKQIVNDEVQPPKLYYERNGERKFISPKYVKKQCQIFLDIADGNDSKYIINEKRIAKIDKICKILVMAKGIKTGCKIYDALSGYQWLLIVASLCTVYRNNKKKRRYETVLLEICRKNGKTFIVAFLILLLFYLEPKFSRFFSVAPDGTLAKEIKQALEPLIKANIDVFEDGEFKILRDNITHKPTETVYTPLNTSKNRMDGRESTVFVADEVGALVNSYPIEAMRSGQLLVVNKLGFLISTKYPTFDNPMEDEVNYFKKVLDGIIEDEHIFGLLFEPNETKNWTTDDGTILAEAIGFIPEGRIEEKNQIEKINYNEFINAMKCIACGDKTVDYKVIEDFVFSIEEKYDVVVMGIGYDRYNALSSAQKWDTKYTTVQVRQHSDTLHPPTKLLYEKIMNREFKYETNKLLEINFQNAKCVYDTNMNRYIHKKKSNGKVDLIFSLLNAIYLLQQEIYLENGNFFVQVG